MQTFGTADKPILVGSVMLGALVLAAIGGILARRRFTAGALVLVLLVARPALPRSCRPGAGPAGRRPRPRHRRRPASERCGGSPTPRPTPQAPRSTPPTARAAAGCWSARRARRGRGGDGRGRPADRGAPRRPERRRAPRPPPTRRRRSRKGSTARCPASRRSGPPRRASTGSTPGSTLPVVDTDGWTLTIDGDVEQEVTLTFDDLLAMDLIERDITLTCVSNDVGGPYVGGGPLARRAAHRPARPGGRRRRRRPDPRHRRRRHDHQHAAAGSPPTAATR